MSAEVIDLLSYRKRKEDERRLRSVRGRGYPVDYMVGYDEPGEDFSVTDQQLADFIEKDEVSE